jgi:glutathione S-transferase
VDYEKVMVDLQNKPQYFVDLYAIANPLPGARAKVPLLEVIEKNSEGQDETLLLCESLIVADYIADQYGANTKNNPLPDTAKDRATMRLFTELCGSSFSYFPLLRAKGDTLESALKTFQEGLVATNAFLKHHHHKSGPFLLGDRFSLSECNAAPFVQRACTILPAFTSSKESTSKVINPLEICDDLGLAHLKGWMEAVLARPSVIETGVSEEKLLEGTTRMLERFAAMETK